MGNSTLMREEARDVWLWPSLDALRQDAAYTLRDLRRKPAASTRDTSTSPSGRRHSRKPPASRSSRSPSASGLKRGFGTSPGSAPSSFGSLTHRRSSGGTSTRARTRRRRPHPSRC
jgi:hypothetical protein